MIAIYLAPLYLLLNVYFLFRILKWLETCHVYFKKKWIKAVLVMIYVFLANGFEEIEALAPHKVFPGDRPSSTLLYRRLDPRTLGRLVALYEHKIFVQSVLWDINPFDQWGVELGKELCGRLAPLVRDRQASTDGLDASTAGLIAARRRLQG